MSGKAPFTGPPSTPKKVRVRGKGQFTIPAEFRRRLGIGEDAILDVFQVGRAIVVTPSRSTVRELAGQVQARMKEGNLDLEDLLAELRDGEHGYREED